jgi:hypothetical protein
MSNVGSAASGKTLVGAGNGSSPTFVDIGTNSGLTEHGVVVSEGNSAFVSINPGSAGQVLVSNGAGTDPSFQAVSEAGAVMTITGNDGFARSPSAGNFNIVGAGSITTGSFPSNNTIVLTGLTNHSLLVGAGTSTITKVGPTATAGQVLQSAGSSADPVFSTATYPSTTTVNQILYSSAANVIGGITTGNNQMLVTSGTGVPSISNTLAGNFSFSIGTAGSTEAVTVANTDNTNAASNAVVIHSTGGTSAGDAFDRYAIGTARSYAAGIDNSDAQSYVINTGATGTTGPSTGTRILRLDSTGNLATPLNSCVTADLNTGLTNSTGDSTFINPVIFDIDTGGFFDQNGNYNTTTGIFTAPATGKYLVTARVTFNGLGAAHTTGIIRINLNGVAYMIKNFNPFACANAAGEYTAEISGILPIAATGTTAIIAQVSGGTKTVGVKGQTAGSFTSLSIVLVS